MVLLDKQFFLAVIDALAKTSLMRLWFLLRYWNNPIHLLYVSISSRLPSSYLLEWFAMD